jgi:hypothetical protein
MTNHCHLLREPERDGALGGFMQSVGQRSVQDLNDARRKPGGARNEPAAPPKLYSDPHFWHGRIPVMVRTAHSSPRSSRGLAPRSAARFATNGRS